MSEPVQQHLENSVIHPSDDRVAGPLEHTSAPPRRRGWRRVAIMCVMLGGFATYMVILPVIETFTIARRPAAESYASPDMSLAENIRLRSAEILFVLWFFAFGASFGSFLNVVAARMARGKSFGGSSHCPHCNTRIARRDLVPILGWLMLAGRCRTCGVRISPRYPLVEALTGAVLVMLLFAELLSGCANVPFTKHYSYDGFVWILFYPKWDVVGMYAYHMMLIYFLLVVSLLEWERALVPKRLILTGIVLGILCPAIWPTLHPVPWLMQHPDWLDPWSWLKRIDSAVAGIAVGACFGVVLSSARPLRHSSSALHGAMRRPETVSMVLVGVFLGWQSVLSVAALTALFRLMAVTFAIHWPRFAKLPTSGWILALTTLHLCLWRRLTEWLFWPGPHSSFLVLSISCVCIVVTSRAIRWSSREPCPDHAVGVEFGEGVPS